MNTNQTLNSNLNLDEPFKAIEVIDFLFFLLSLDSFVNVWSRSVSCILSVSVLAWPFVVEKIRKVCF